MMPLALRLSPEIDQALRRRAVRAGVDPDGPDYSAFVARLVVEGIPDAVAEALQRELADSSPDADRPGQGARTSADILTAPPVASDDTGRGLSSEDAPGGVA